MVRRAAGREGAAVIRDNLALRQGIASLNDCSHGRRPGASDPLRRRAPPFRRPYSGKPSRENRCCNAQLTRSAKPALLFKTLIARLMLFKLPPRLAVNREY